MKYKPNYKIFTADIIIKDKDQYKFIVDGIYKINKDYETTYV